MFVLDEIWLKASPLPIPVSSEDTLQYSAVDFFCYLRIAGVEVSGNAARWKIEMCGL